MITEQTQVNSHIDVNGDGQEHVKRGVLVPAISLPDGWYIASDDDETGDGVSMAGPYKLADLHNEIVSANGGHGDINLWRDNRLVYIDGITVVALEIPSVWNPSYQDDPSTWVRHASTTPTMSIAPKCPVRHLPAFSMAGAEPQVREYDRLAHGLYIARPATGTPVDEMAVYIGPYKDIHEIARRLPQDAPGIQGQDFDPAYHVAVVDDESSPLVWSRTVLPEPAEPTRMGPTWQEDRGI